MKIKSEIIEQENTKTKKIFLNQNLTLSSEIEQLSIEIRQALLENLNIEIITEKNAIVDISFLQIIFSALKSASQNQIKLYIDIEPQTLELIKNSDLIKLITPNKIYEQNNDN